MSSRLFQSVREEKGLAYDVSSYVVDYADAGAFVVSAGVDPDKIAPAVGAILEELARVRDERSRPTSWPGQGVPGGRLELRMEETRHLASWLGGQEALHERVLTLDEALAELNAVTGEGIHALAGRLDPRRRAASGGRGAAPAGPPLEALLRLPGGAA